MDIAIFAAANFVLTIAFFERKLLIDRGSREVIFGISLALFVVAVFLSLVMRSWPTLFPSLMRPGLAADRLFNVLYFTLGTFLMLLLWMSADLTGYKWH